MNFPISPQLPITLRPISSFPKIFPKHFVIRFYTLLYKNVTSYHSIGNPQRYHETGVSDSFHMEIHSSRRRLYLHSYTPLFINLTSDQETQLQFPSSYRLIKPEAIKFSGQFFLEIYLTRQIIGSDLVFRGIAG